MSRPSKTYANRSPAAEELLENHPEPLIAVDEEWRLVSANRAAEAAIGRSRGALLGQVLWRIEPPVLGPRSELPLRRALEEGNRAEVEDRLGGTGRRVSVLAYRVGDGLAIWLREASGEPGREGVVHFLSRVSHELRTPTSAVLGFSQLLELEPLTPAQRKNVEQIKVAGGHLLSLIDEVLDIARIGAGQQSISSEAVGAQEVVQQSLALLSPLADEHGIDLHTEFPAGPVRVQADRQRLKQVMLNLVSNAIKYNRRGGSVSIRCTAVPEGRVRISVQDTGEGIPAEMRGRLFEPFDRLGAEGSGMKGTGLGLALSKSLVEAMAGRIGLDSVAGEGSTFWIELPAHPDPVHDPAVETEPAPGQATSPERQAQTILCIDDNLANLKLIERILDRRPGVDLVTATTGRTGLEIAARLRPRIILLDLALPDIGGEEVLHRLRADERTWSTPIVVLSGGAAPEQVERLLGAGASEYMRKPFDVHALLQVLDRFLEEEPRR